MTTPGALPPPPPPPPPVAPAPSPIEVVVASPCLLLLLLLPADAAATTTGDGPLKNGSKSGTSNDMSNVADEDSGPGVISLVIENEVSGKALAKEASKASGLLSRPDDDDDDDNDDELFLDAVFSRGRFLGTTRSSSSSAA